MNYIIKYRLDNASGTFKFGEIVVKNKPSKFVAQCALEAYFLKKYPFMDAMIVESCENHNDILGQLRDIFKTK